MKKFIFFPEGMLIESLERKNAFIVKAENRKKAMEKIFFYFPLTEYDFLLSLHDDNEIFCIAESILFQKSMEGFPEKKYDEELFRRSMVFFENDEKFSMMYLDFYHDREKPITPDLIRFIWIKLYASDDETFNRNYTLVDMDDFTPFE